MDSDERMPGDWGEQPDDSNPHGVEGCLSLHDYTASVEYLTPKRCRIEIDCPKCGERTLHFGDWRNATGGRNS